MPSSYDSWPHASGPSDRSTDRIDVVLVDDHPPIRGAIRQAVDDTMDMQVVAETGSTGEAFDLVGEARPDVAVIDLSLRDGHGFDLLKNLQGHHPDTELLVFSMHDERVYAERALRAGASGYLMKEGSSQQVLAAIRCVSEGGVYLSPDMTSRVLQEMVDDREEAAHFPIDDLTDRELQVFQLLGQGRTVSAIADQLNLARKTVETYRRRVKEKLGYDTSAEVVSHAARWVLGAPEGEESSSASSASE